MTAPRSSSSPPISTPACWPRSRPVQHRCHARAVAIVLGFLTIRRRDIVRHRAWMIRAYAIGQGAGTQALTHAPWVLTAGQPGAGTRAVLMIAAWTINLVVAEWIIRRRPRPIRSSPGAAVDREHSAGHEGGPVAQQPRRGLGDLGRIG
ncbi:DUF2306 domain-containing protein [Actinoplanes sp. CA-051413]|uniref:DUF2306 domain-containing protein n=1 Tax=Actinoplanes sp. CA-051413 TaxID=3239899 RepID=UPI003D9569ED